MKNKEQLVRIFFLVISTILVVGILIFIINFGMLNISSDVKVGAVLLGTTDDMGWNESHYNGIKSACNLHHCTMYFKESVPEEERPVKNAVSQLVGQGCSVIFLTSYGYGRYADSVARAYPNVAIYSISGESKADNFMSYFARVYQVRYLAGIVAGSASDSGILGLITAMPIPETIRSVNAYALGARKANPNARVIVKYTGGWNDKEKEEAAAKELMDAGVDVMTFHEDRPYVIDLADEMGIYTTGYDYVAGEYSDRFLTAAVFNWDMLYSRILSDFLSGRANFSNDYWLGLKEGAVSLYPYSDLVTQETKDLVATEKERLKTWRDVFSGEIYDNTGALRCNEDEAISDAELFNSIDWYVEGVEIYE